ncbi:MAG: hypothetical protein MR923_02305 [Prevotella sp.]|nr:hypothetical protein [Prevotella sp.]
MQSQARLSYAEPMEQREESRARSSYPESRQRKTKSKCSQQSTKSIKD